MNKIDKFICAYKIGGMRYALALIQDKILKTDKASQLFYEISKKAKSEQYDSILENYYYVSTGKHLNLKKPQTLSEKIQWLKLYDSTPIKTRLCDKYLAREWIADRIGSKYLIPLLGVWDKFDDICFDLLPNSFVLKTNHGSGTNIIVKDKKLLNIQDSKKQIEQWMKINFAYVHGFELQYRDVPVKIIAEKYMASIDAEGMCDYRFFCFHGVPKQIWVDKYSGTLKHIRSIYDMDWNKLQITCSWPDGGEELSQKPESFEEMKKLAMKLSQDFIFVRVDFYEIDGKVYVGELTFTPMSGMGDIRPESADYELGKMLHLPID